MFAWALLLALASSSITPLHRQFPDAASTLAVDYERSTIVAKLNKTGLLRFLGHEHGVVPGAWSAAVQFDPQNLDAASIVVEIMTPDLDIDSESARRLADVDPDGPSPEEINDISARMLSEGQLDAASFPVILFESTRLRLRNDELRIEGILTVHGESHSIEVDADYELVAAAETEVTNRTDDAAASYVVRGRFTIKQRDFGIEPVSIGGVVKVADEVEISFEIFATSPAPRTR